jgi:hypothetical protein
MKRNSMFIKKKFNTVKGLFISVKGLFISHGLFFILSVGMLNFIV